MVIEATSNHCVSGLCRRCIFQLDVRIRLGRVVVVAVVTKLDNGKGLENSARETLGAALPGSSTDATARSISFGITVGTDGPGTDDDQKEDRDQAGDAVQDAHSNCRVVATGLRILVLVHTGDVACNGRSYVCRGACGHVGNLAGCVAVWHREDSLEVEVLSREAAALALLAVEENGSWLRILAHECIEHLVRSCIRAVDLVAGQVRNGVSTADALVGGFVGENQSAVEIDVLEITGQSKSS